MVNKVREKTKPRTSFFRVEMRTLHKMLTGKQSTTSATSVSTIPYGYGLLKLKQRLRLTQKVGKGVQSPHYNRVSVLSPHVVWSGACGPHNL